MPEPEIAPKKQLARTATAPKPPVTAPIKLLANATIRLAMPPVDMIEPASIKKGIDKIVKELTPE